MVDLKKLALYIDDGREGVDELHQFLGYYEGLGYSPLIFLNNLGTFCSKYPCMASEALWNFKGIIVADSFLSARYLLECPVRSTKYFWVREADWTNPKFPAIDKVKVHQTHDLRRFCGNEDLWNVYTKVWNKDCTLVDLTKGDLFE